jgi:hypothetical protein
MNFISTFLDGTRPSLDRILSVEFETGMARTRKVVSRSNTRATGKWPSWKLGRMAYYDSLHEANAFRLLDAWPEVKSYAEQPCRIRYVLQWENHLHVPDILVDFGNRRELWEVKTARDAQDSEVRRRTSLMTQCLPAFGYQYRLITAEDLGRQPRLENMRYLFQHGRNPVPPLEREQLRQRFRESGELSWRHFRMGGIYKDWLRAVCRLILEGVIALDIEQVWDDSTLIRWVG